MDQVSVNIFSAFFEYFCLWLFFYWVFGKKEGISKRYYWSVNLLMPVYCFFLSSYVANFTLRSILYVLSIILPATMFNGKMRNKLSFGVIYLVIQMICEMLVSMILLKVHQVTVIPFAAEVYAVGVVYVRILCLFVTVIMAAVLARKNLFAFTADKTQLALLLFIPLVSIFVIYILMDNLLKLEHYGYYRTIAAIIGILLANGALFYVHNEINKQALLKRQLSELNAIQKMQEENLLNLEDKNKENRQLLHDVKHYFLILKGYILNEEKQKGLDYIDGLLEEIEEKHFTLTGNGIIDTLLSFKSMQAKKKGIVIHYSVFLAETNIAATDIALILANALDNAIEATAKIADEARKSIRLSLLNRGNHLKIEVVNPISKPLNLKNNTLQSTKFDKTAHGFGLKNIQSLAQKNNGEMFISCAGQEFKLTVILTNKK